MRRRDRRRVASAFALGLLLTAGATTSAAASPPTMTLAVDDDGVCRANDPVTFEEKPTPALALLQAQRAWTLTKGEGITVAVVDSGVNGADPRLAPVLVGGINIVPDGKSRDGRVDLDGHGTQVASLIAAQATEKSGLVGLAPGVHLLPVRVFADRSEQSASAGFGPKPEYVAAGIRAAVDAGAQIINVSLSEKDESPLIGDAVLYANSHSVLVVASSGTADSSSARTTPSPTATSDQPDVRYPAGSRGVLGVNAVTVPGLAATAATVAGPHVALSAPGQGLTMIGLNTGDCVLQSDPATSYATPLVAASAALVAAAHPTETAAQWAYRLEATALRGDPDHRTDAYGWGIVQPYEAIALVPGADVRGPMNAFLTNTDEPTPDTTPEIHRADLVPTTDQHAIDLRRVLIVGAIALAALSTIGILAIYRDRRRSQPASNTVHADEEDVPDEP